LGKRCGTTKQLGEKGLFGVKLAGEIPSAAKAAHQFLRPFAAWLKPGPDYKTCSRDFFTKL
jgi:hypothetical protein